MTPDGNTVSSDIVHANMDFNGILSNIFHDSNDKFRIGRKMLGANFLPKIRLEKSCGKHEE